jgi:dephospho-CoA kinase
MNAIEKEWEEKRQLLTDELARIESLLTSAYDRYLERNLPSSDTMPVTVKLSVPEKDFAVDDIIIKPSDTMGSILKKVEELMKGHNIEVVSFPPCEELQISLLRYLERNLPSSDTMPVTVKLSVPEKDFAVDDIIIKPSDTMGSILKKVEELMKGHNIEVVSFPPCEELQISLLRWSSRGVDREA